MLYKINLEIGSFLIKWLENKESFECRSFYGETFTLALLERNELLTEDIRAKLISLYTRIDKSDSQFHWEFNNYAILDYYEKSKDENVIKFLEPLKFKNTTCTNWTLLRCVTRVKLNIDYDVALREAKNKIKKFQLHSGLILDDKGVKSFQYHCFSMAMIGELYENTKIEFFKKSFIKGVKFIRYFILENGETLYIGRGQNQSFGYGALIYILALAYKLERDNTLLGDIEKVISYLKSYQRENGSFPLVMNGIEKSIPEIIDMEDEEFVGWYPYNNYFDYLPFLGFFIAKAEEILKEFNDYKIEFSKRKEYRDKDFIKIIKNNYEAVLSKVGGYWTNDIPMPYIVTRFKAITPCYGGEHFQKSLYTLEGIPLPFFYKIKRSIRWRSKSFFTNNILWIISPLGLMKRSYKFFDEHIEVETKVYSPFSFNHVYLFCNSHTIKKNINLKYDGYEYSSSGKLEKYIDNNMFSKVRIDIEN